MRILQLTPGTGSFFCGSCLRDNDLVEHLRRLGHDAQIAPLYLPFKLEDAREAAAAQPVHMGGINVYLQQLAPWTRRLPRFLAKVLDAPGLLRFASSRSNMTDPSGLGPLTLSVLRGEEGRQVGEIEKLVEWMGTLERPDVVMLSNAMLMGLARRIRERLGCPVVVTMQGEAPFLDALAEEHSRRCWETLAERARDVDAFLPVSRYTADLMTERMGLDPAKVHVVHNGIALEGLEPPEAPPTAPTIGYLARLCADKGLPLLVDAYLELRRRGTVPGVRLHAGGVCLTGDEPLVREQERKLEAAGAMADASLRRGLTREEKIELLRGATVLSVPALYGESFGLYLLEALACGVPVVQPEVAAFPEVVAATGGGLLTPPTVEGLADGLEAVLTDPERRAALGAAGRSAVARDFTSERMARDVARVCSMVAGTRTASA